MRSRPQFEAWRESRAAPGGGPAVGLWTHACQPSCFPDLDGTGLGSAYGTPSSGGFLPPTQPPTFCAVIG